MDNPQGCGRSLQAVERMSGYEWWKLGTATKEWSCDIGYSGNVFTCGMPCGGPYCKMILCPECALVAGLKW